MPKRAREQLRRVAKNLGTTWQQVVRDYFTYLDVCDRGFAIDRVVRDMPEAGWLLVLELVRRAPDKHLSTIAAGPLENLLAYHGKRVIRRVELEAKRNERLRFALRGTWPQRMTKAVYARMERACADIPPY